MVIVIHFSRIIGTVVLFFFTIIHLPDFISNINYSITDLFTSLIILVVLLLYILIKKNKPQFLKERINFTSAIIIVLIFFFALAPMISTTNPDFQNNIGVSKLLPPLSSVKYLITKSSEKENNELTKLSDQLIDEQIIYIDSLNKISNTYYFYTNTVKKNIDEAGFQFENNSPVVKTRIFLLGTDEFGRDIFSRLIYGTRISLTVGLGAVMVAFFLGILLGFLSGYSGWFLDTLLNRFTDMFLSFPAIFLIILILAFFGSSLFTIIIILGFSGWMSLFKIVRSEVIAIKQKDFFITASMIGLSGWRLLFNEIFPVIIAPVIVNLIFLFGNVILAEAALSYLGLGTSLNYPSWGGMIESGQEYLSQAWWMIFFPGFALIVTLFTANNLGRILNTYYNPRLQK